jgi:hypothetical protein
MVRRRNDPPARPAYRVSNRRAQSPSQPLRAAGGFCDAALSARRLNALEAHLPGRQAHCLRGSYRPQRLIRLRWCSREDMAPTPFHAHSPEAQLVYGTRDFANTSSSVHRMPENCWPPARRPAKHLTMGGIENSRCERSKNAREAAAHKLPVWIKWVEGRTPVKD